MKKNLFLGVPPIEKRQKQQYKQPFFYGCRAFCYNLFCSFLKKKDFRCNPSREPIRYNTTLPSHIQTNSISILLLFLITSFTLAQETPPNAKKILLAYPEKIKGFKNNTFIFYDNSTLIYDDRKQKNNQELLDNPDIEDQFNYLYNNKVDNHFEDAGRIRNEAFFKKMYGNSKAEVQKNLVTITWCPQLVNQKIKVTKVNGVDKALIKIAAELDKHPEYKKYISNIGGTFNWRKITGTNRLSLHSFGMTIDINVKYSDYWQWNCKCTDEAHSINYQNKIPSQIVKIFENHGFIWGGKWYHYDTMHFEYRPEFYQ